MYSKNFKFRHILKLRNSQVAKFLLFGYRLVSEPATKLVAHLCCLTSDVVSARLPLQFPYLLHLLMRLLIPNHRLIPQLEVTKVILDCALKLLCICDKLYVDRHITTQTLVHLCQ